MSAKDFTKGYFLGLFIIGALDLLTANKADNAIKYTKEEMLKTQKTEIITQKQTIKGTDTLNTTISTPAHIVPDTIIMKLKI